MKSDRINKEIFQSFCKMVKRSRQCGFDITQEWDGQLVEMYLNSRYANYDNTSFRIWTLGELVKLAKIGDTEAINYLMSLH